MSTWEDRFSNHPTHETLSNIQQVLDDDNISSDDLGIKDQLNRLSQVINYIRKFLKISNPTLIPLTALDTLNTHLSNVYSSLNKFLNSENTALLDTANQQADTAIISTCSFPILLKPKDFDSFSDNVVKFRQMADEFLNFLKEEKDSFKEELDQLRTLSDNNGEKIQKQDELIEKHKERLDSIISELQSQFSQSEDRNREKFSSQLEEESEKFEELREEFKQEQNGLVNETNENFNTLSSGITEKSEEILDTLEEKKLEASDLVQVIGNIGVTGNYQKIANQEKKTADTFRLIALGFMALMVFGIIYTIFIAADNGFDWKLALFRLGAAMIFAIPASYAARESSKHRQAELTNRRIELELASLNPYMEKLPPEKKNELKEKLIEKFFGRQDQESSNDSVSQSGLLDVIKMAMQNLTKK
jgi:hypothetical protein